MKTIINKTKKRNTYGTVKETVSKCCENNMSAKEIYELHGISPHTTYKTARLLMIRPRYVHKWKIHLKSI